MPPCACVRTALVMEMKMYRVMLLAAFLAMSGLSAMASADEAAGTTTLATPDVMAPNAASDSVPSRAPSSPTRNPEAPFMEMPTSPVQRNLENRTHFPCWLARILLLMVVTNGLMFSWPRSAAAWVATRPPFRRAQAVLSLSN
jgi:hypothetical protein